MRKRMSVIVCLTIQTYTSERFPVSWSTNEECNVLFSHLYFRKCCIHVNLSFKKDVLNKSKKQLEGKRETKPFSVRKLTDLDWLKTVLFANENLSDCIRKKWLHHHHALPNASWSSQSIMCEFFSSYAIHDFFILTLIKTLL